jgi:hypothetical protein
VHFCNICQLIITSLPLKQNDKLISGRQHLSIHEANNKQINICYKQCRQHLCCLQIRATILQNVAIVTGKGNSGGQQNVNDAGFWCDRVWPTLWSSILITSQYNMLTAYTATIIYIVILKFFILWWWVCGGAVGWGTALKARRSRVRFPMVSLEFFIDIILPAALWPWEWLSL